jgi:indolepyruvate ferredoxin oxidoreductase alpha subunit
MAENMAQEGDAQSTSYKDLPERILLGNAAIALGAIRAGIHFASGYAGTPSTEILETLIKEKPEGVYVEWSVNEKAALEAAAGAAIAGAFALVTMKQVGLNVASDPLMSLNYIGVKGALVVVATDDPGPSSSQTEQDSRIYGKFANIAVFDPSTPSEAYQMIADAFDFSHRFARPVIFRPTTRLCHGSGVVKLEEPLPKITPEGFTKDGGKWVIFPRLVYSNHIKIEAALKELSDIFSEYKGNILIKNGQKRGIACGGVCYPYIAEILKDNVSCAVLKISTYPFPEKLALEFLDGLEEVLTVEELDPYIEDELIALNGASSNNRRIRGKRTGELPFAGEYLPEKVKAAVDRFLGTAVPEASSIPSVTSSLPGLAPCGGAGGTPALQQARAAAPALPVRPPVLCAGCPHRASFYAVKYAVREALRKGAAFKKAVFSGDIGCYTLGNTPPLDMVDTCLCMGAGITVAQGLNRIEKDALNFAFIGDSTFFHTGIAGVINAVYNSSDIIVIILDNLTTAMTGCQPHPGTGKTASGENSPKIDLPALLSALGVLFVRRVSAFDISATSAAVKEAVNARGVRAVIFEGACIAIKKEEKKVREFYKVDDEACTGCRICAARLGCPALTVKNGKAFIDEAICSPCSLCASVCPIGAIRSFSP